MADLIVSLGPWSWVAFGLLLLAAEILVPGVFLIWIGVAALLIGLLSLILWDLSLWTWQVQVLLFLVAALVAALAGRSMMRQTSITDQPLLNRRSEQLVGRTATLEQPITNGRGRIRIDDTTWRVNGPDLAAGMQVRVVAARDGELSVEPVW